MTKCHLTFTIHCILCLFNIQVTTYNEDFKAERSDRERAQATIQAQKDEMAGIKQMVVVMVSKVYSMLIPPPPPNAPL